MTTIQTLSLDDRSKILQLADACADNKDEKFGLSFYDASILRFAIAVSRMALAGEVMSEDREAPQ